MKHIIPYIILLFSCQISTISDSQCLDIMNHVHKTVQGVPDDTNNWQTPQETIERGAGDCEDMALLMLYIAKHEYGINGHIVIIDLPGDHACCMINDTLYDPAFNIVRDEHKIVKVSTYQDAITYAEAK